MFFRVDPLYSGTTATFLRIGYLADLTVGSIYGVLAHANTVPRFYKDLSIRYHICHPSLGFFWK